MTAISGGNATVTASVGAVSATAPVTVTGAALQAIVVTGAATQLPRGYTLQLTATAQFDDGTSRDITPFATWTSSNTSVASVYTASGLAGLVTGSYAGPVTITATLGSHAGTYSMTITNARLQSIVASPASVTVAVRGKQQLSATGQFDDGSSIDITRQVTWKSQQRSIASVVTKGGLLTGLRTGNASVTAKKGHVVSPAVSVTVQ
jgi:uncharacterized protein YjdB